MSAMIVRDGFYSMSLVVDEYIGDGSLTMVGNNGQGHDGVFKIEVHVSGEESELRGVINILLVSDVARRHHVPEHFSLSVAGSGTEAGFNLIGTGPGQVLVEVEAQWQQVVPPSVFPDHSLVS